MEKKKISIGLLIAIIGLAISFLSCIAAWVVIPDIGDLIFPNRAESSNQNSETKSDNPSLTENQQPTSPLDVEILFEPTPATPDSSNLINNGYFLNDFDGWSRELVDEGGSSKINIINFGSSLFNRALHMDHEGLGTIYFYQDVHVPSTNLIFSCSFNTNSTEGLIIGFSGTGYSIIGLVYMDVRGNELGYTRILNINESLFAGTAFIGAPEAIADTNTLHNIEVDSEKTYKDYSIDIQNELNNNLLGIDPSQVDVIRIIFLVGSNDKNASAELTVSDVILKEK